MSNIQNQATRFDATEDERLTPGQAEGEDRDVNEYASQRRRVAEHINDTETSKQQSKQSPGNQHTSAERNQQMQAQAERVRGQFQSGIDQVNRAIEQNETTSRIRNRVESMAAEQGISLNDLKRWVAMIGGGMLAFTGLRRSLGSLSLAGIGAAIFYWGMSGESPLNLLKQRQPTTHQDAETRIRNGEFNSASMSATPKLVTKNIIVKASVDKAYEIWSNFENFPKFMQHIRSVYKTGDDLSHWVMEGPMGTKIEWNARTTRLDPNKRIGWNSIDGDIKTSGQVTFNSLPDQQTEVTVTLQYVPPAGLAGEVVAEIFGNPEGKLTEDLRNFKKFIEKK